MCMSIRKGGPYYENLLRWPNFEKIAYYVERENLIEAYRIAGEKGNNQLPHLLTLYLIHEHDPIFRYDPLGYMNFVPENYLYEVCEDDLVVYVAPHIEEIKDNAFRYCKIKKLIISKGVKIIGDSALCMNGGEIYYEGTKQEFLNLILGKSKCFVGTRTQTVICSDGEITIEGN